VSEAKERAGEVGITTDRNFSPNEISILFLDATIHNLTCVYRRSYCYKRTKWTTFQLKIHKTFIKKNYVGSGLGSLIRINSDPDPISSKNSGSIALIYKMFIQVI
jgi:hypothetical protein